MHILACLFNYVVKVFWTQGELSGQEEHSQKKLWEACLQHRKATSMLEFELCLSECWHKRSLEESHVTHKSQVRVVSGVIDTADISHSQVCMKYASQNWSLFPSLPTPIYQNTLEARPLPPHSMIECCVKGLDLFYFWEFTSDAAQCRQ